MWDFCGCDRLFTVLRWIVSLHSLLPIVISDPTLTRDSLKWWNTYLYFYSIKLGNQGTTKIFILNIKVFSFLPPKKSFSPFHRRLWRLRGLRPQTNLDPLMPGSNFHSWKSIYPFPKVPVGLLLKFWCNSLAEAHTQPLGWMKICWTQFCLDKLTWLV